VIYFRNKSDNKFGSLYYMRTTFSADKKQIPRFSTQPACRPDPRSAIRHAVF